MSLLTNTGTQKTPASFAVGPASSPQAPPVAKKALAGQGARWAVLLGILAAVWEGRLAYSPNLASILLIRACLMGAVYGGALGWLLGAVASRFGWARCGMLIGIIVAVFLGRLQEAVLVLVPVGALVGVVGGLIARDGINALLLGGVVLGAVACSLFGAVGGLLDFPPPWEMSQKHPVLGGVDGFVYGACLGGFAGWLLGQRKDGQGHPTRRKVDRGMAVGSVVGGAVVSVLGALALPFLFSVQGPNSALVNGLWAVFGFLVGGFLGTFGGALTGVCLDRLIGAILLRGTNSEPRQTRLGREEGGDPREKLLGQAQPPGTAGRHL